MEYKVIINGYNPPAVKEEGYSVTPNKIWSSNTKRSATGKMFGDIVATKYTLKLSWDRMKGDILKDLSNAIRSKAFFDVTFFDEKGESLTRQFYSADTTFTLKKILNGKTLYSQVNVELIER